MSCLSSCHILSVAQLIHIVGRAGSKNSGKMKTLPIPYDGSPDANLQFVNTYEDENGAIIIDAIRSDGSSTRGSSTSNTQWPWATTLSAFQSMSSKKSLWRYKLYPQSGTVSKERISNDQVYFGVVNSKMSGQKHRYVYAAVGALGNDVAPPQGIIKLDLENNTQEYWLPEAYEFCGEPMYASREGGDNCEDGGYILSILYNGKDERSELVVLKAADIIAGPIARVPIGVAVPHGYHGCFAQEDANWTYEEIERRAKLADKMETRGSMWNEVKSDFSGLGLRFDDMEEYFGDMM
jgi:all-trans-8'-apo-beta-carotenal 15,15'-oxygenase